MSEETKQKISKSKKGITLSEETKRKMSVSRKGKTSYRKFSLETEIKITTMYVAGFSTKILSEQYKCSIVTIRNIIKRNINEIK